MRFWFHLFIIRASFVRFNRERFDRRPLMTLFRQSRSMVSFLRIREWRINNCDVQRRRQREGGREILKGNVFVHSRSYAYASCMCTDAKEEEVGRANSQFHAYFRLGRRTAASFDRKLLWSAPLCSEAALRYLRCARASTPFASSQENRRKQFRLITFSIRSSLEIEPIS